MNGIFSPVLLRPSILRFHAFYFFLFMYQKYHSKKGIHQWLPICSQLFLLEYFGMRSIITEHLSGEFQMEGY